MAKVRKHQQSERQATVENTAAGAAPFLELGITGVTRYGGISRVYEEFLRELQGPAGMKLLREQADNCPITGAFLFAAQHLARQTTFRVDPANKSPEAQRVAERFRAAVFDDMTAPWPDTLSEILSMLTFGWCAQEMVFKRCQGPEPPPSVDAATGLPLKPGEQGARTDLLPHDLGSRWSFGQYGQGPRATTRWSPSKFDDGFIGFKKWSVRAQETMFMWEWDDESNPIVLQQLAPPDYRIRRIPLAKCLHFRTETVKNNPEGRSILRNSVLSYLYRKNVQNVEAIGIGRDLTGYPVFQLAPPDKAPGQVVPDLWNTKDPNATAALNALKQSVREIKRDEQEGLVLPWWVDFKLVSAGGARRQFDTNAIVTRYDQRIAMTVLADFIMLGHEAVGSKALASTKSSLFTTALTGILSIITSVINRFAFPLLAKLNGIPTELIPTMAHGDIDTIDLADLGQFIANLAGSGMPLFPDADLEQALLEAAKLPTSGIIDPQTELYGNDTGGLSGPDGQLSPPPTNLADAPSVGQPPQQAPSSTAQKVLKALAVELAQGRPRGRAMVGATAKRYVVHRDKAGRIYQVVEA